MKKSFIIYMVSFPLTLCALLVSCQQSAPASTANEIAQEAIEAIAELDTYQFNIDRIITITNEEGQASYVWDIYGAVDEIEKEIHHTMQIRGKEASGYSVEYNHEEYMVGNWLYEKFDDDPWSKSQSEHYWHNRDYASQQLDLLTTLIPVELIGIDTVDGVDCYKVQLQPDKVSLWSWITLQGWGQVLEGHQQELTGDIVSDYSIFQWITKDAYFLIKSVVDVAFKVNSDTIVYTETVLLHHLNEPVSIELPTEAEP
jgi:hypothetical protein